MSSIITADSQVTLIQWLSWQYEWQYNDENDDNNCDADTRNNADFLLQPQTIHRPQAVKYNWNQN